MMNKKNLSYLSFLFAYLVLFSSCKKDGEMSLDAGIHLNYGISMEAYDEFGPQLEAALSLAAENPEFAMELVKQTQTMPTGDFEVLLANFFRGKLESGTTVKDFVTTKSNGLFTSRELDNFLMQYPSVIIGLRGNPISWLEEKHVPAVKFVDSNFDKSKEECSALQSGKSVILNLKNAFEDAVIAIHISERHDYNGLPVVVPSNEDNEPTLSANDMSSTSKALTCNPEPTSCPSLTPNVNSFTAAPENGVIKLSYNISNFPVSLCYWGRIRIQRLNPDGSYTTFNRFAHSPNIFNDNTADIGVTYSYTINVYVAYQNTSGWAPICPATNNLLVATASSPDFGPPLNTFVGSNISNTTIRYDWTPVSGASISEYRLQRSTSFGYVNLANLGTSSTSYFYQHSSSDRGKLVETRIQYKSAGLWQGNFYDRTYASHRTNGESFKYYGVRMNNVTAFEYGENNLFGAPEIRLTAVQATASETTIVLANTFMPMTPCTELVFWGGQAFHINTGVFFPTNSPNGYTILSNWNSDLYGTAIRVKTTETDFHVPVITDQTNTSSNEVSVNAKFGFKLFDTIGVETGITSTWKNSSVTKIRYPTSDIEIGDDLIYYHEPRIRVKGIQLFGKATVTNSNRCDVLEAQL